MNDIIKKYVDTNKLLQNCKGELKDVHKKYEDTNKLLQSCSEKRKSHEDRRAKRMRNDNIQDDNLKKDEYINKLYIYIIIGVCVVIFIFVALNIRIKILEQIIVRSGN